LRHHLAAEFGFLSGIRLVLEWAAATAVSNLINPFQQLFCRERLKLANGQTNKFLYAVQGLGAAFAGVFLTAYLMGLQNVPKDVVYHSEPAFRATLSVLGLALVVISLVVIAAVALWRKKE
jgi:hypothetical protein